MFGLFNKDSSPVTPAAPTIPVTPTVTPTTTPEPEPSEFDKITNLLYPKKNGEDSKNSDPQKPAEPFDPTTLFNDPETLSKLRESVDFSKSISNETQQLLEAGDPKGFMSAMQDISKASFLEALKISSVLNKTAIDDAVTRILEQSKGQISQSLEDFDLQKEIPQITNPVIRLGLESARQQLKQQNPTMSASELAKTLKGFLAEANKMVNTQSIPDPETVKTENETWEDWVNR